MSYLGNSPTSQTYTAKTDRFNGDGSSLTFTLTRAIYDASSIEVIVNNVQQDPFTSYTVNGTTTLTFTEAPSSGTGNILVTYRNNIVTSIIPDDASISSAKLADGSVTNIKLAGSITGDKLGVGSITSNLLSANAVTGDKIGLTAITSNLIASNAVTGDKIGVGAITSNLLASTITTGNINLSGATSFLSAVFENANVTTLMGANTTINVAQPLVVFTANSSANSTVNFTGLTGMPVGNTASFVIINPNSSTAKYINAYQVDGSATTVKWAGGAPIGGTSANTDIYSFTVIKTSATPTYNIFASVQSYF